MKTQRQAEQLITVLIFLAVIAVFFAGTWITKPKELAVLEQRGISTLPQPTMQTLATFPEKFESYFNDRMLLHKNLISYRNFVKAIAFGASGSPLVLIGQQGWMYFTGDRALDSYMNIDPFSSKDLSQWKAAVDARARWLADRHIKLILCFPPDKTTIYPEMLPREIRQKAGPSRLDQLLERLSAGSAGGSPATVLDLRPTLLQHKTDGQLYFKDDTHWNDIGAFLAYQQILQPITASFPSVHSYSLSDMTQTRKRSNADIAKLLGLQGIFHEYAPSLTPRASTTFSIDQDSLVKDPALLGKIPWIKNQAYFSTSQSRLGAGAAALPRILLFHDSFMVPLMAWIAQSASHSAFYWQSDLVPEIIEKEHPDIVVWEITERFLMNPAPACEWERRLSSRH